MHRAHREAVPASCRFDAGPAGTGPTLAASMALRVRRIAPRWRPELTRRTAGRSSVGADAGRRGLGPRQYFFARLFPAGGRHLFFRAAPSDPAERNEPAYHFVIWTTSTMASARSRLSFAFSSSMAARPSSAGAAAPRKGRDGGAGGRPVFRLSYCGTYRSCWLRLENPTPPPTLGRGCVRTTLHSHGSDPGRATCRANSGDSLAGRPNRSGIGGRG